MDSRLTAALERLARHTGEGPALEAFKQALHTAGLPDKPNLAPQELYSVATALISVGGLVEIVGRTLKVQALMLGAVAPPEDVRAAMDRLSKP
jgi:hypothetical protein